MNSHHVVITLTRSEVNLIENAVRERIAHLQPSIAQPIENETIHQSLLVKLMGVLGCLNNQQRWYEQQKPPAVESLSRHNDLLSFDCWI